MEVDIAARLRRIRGRRKNSVRNTTLEFLPGMNLLLNPGPSFGDVGFNDSKKWWIDADEQIYSIGRECERHLRTKKFRGCVPYKKFLEVVPDGDLGLFLGLERNDTIYRRDVLKHNFVRDGQVVVSEETYRRRIAPHLSPELLREGIIITRDYNGLVVEGKVLNYRDCMSIKTLRFRERFK